MKAAKVHKVIDQPPKTPRSSKEGLEDKNYPLQSQANTDEISVLDLLQMKFESSKTIKVLINTSIIYGYVTVINGKKNLLIKLRST